MQEDRGMIFVIIFVTIDIALRVYLICVITERSQFLERAKIIPTSNLWADVPDTSLSISRSHNLTKLLILAAVVTILSMGIGTIVFISIESWSISDALFFITCTCNIQTFCGFFDSLIDCFFSDNNWI